jgi:hypothetical protein
MVQPDWLDRVRRMMRGVIERAVAEERVSLLHLAARQTDAMAAERFDRDDEKRGVDALLHAMSNMTHAQLDEWQLLTRRGPAWADKQTRAAAASAAAASAAASSPRSGPNQAPSDPAQGNQTPADRTPAASTADPAPAGSGAAASPPAGSRSGRPEEPEVAHPDDIMKAALRERCPWPGSAATPAEAPAPATSTTSATPPTGGGWPSSPTPTPEQAGDPAMAPAPPIRPDAEAAEPEPWPGWNAWNAKKDAEAALRPLAPEKITMPRVVLAKLTPGRPIPGWIGQEPPGRPSERRPP